MSELPKGWAAACISDMLSIRNGYAFKSADFCDEGVLLIRQSELRGGTVDVANAVYLPENFLLDHQTYSISKGDVLIGMSGSLGKVSRYLDDRPALQNQRTGLLAVHDDVADRTFSLYALKYVEPQILEQGKGVAVQNVSSSQIESCHVPLPPRAEQTRIVEKLEELLSDLDAGVAELKAAQKKLAQYRQSLLKAAVEGALTAEWRANNPPTETGAQLLERILQERRARWEAKQLAKFKEQGKAPPKDWQKKYPEPVQPDTTDLPELPQGWVWASVEQLSELMSGNTPKDAEAHASSNGVIPWFKVGDMNREGNEIWLSKSQINFTRHDALSIGMKLAPPGTIVFPKRGGAIATNKKRRLKSLACFDLNTMGLVPVDSSAEWLWWWFQGIDLGRLSDGSNVPQINNPDIAPLVIPVPPVAAHEMTNRQLKMTLDTVQAQEAAIDVSLKQSTAQRQNILKAAFSGQLVPQDPSDEPASELLARIRAERAAQQAIKKPRGRKAKEAA